MPETPAPTTAILMILCPRLRRTFNESSNPMNAPRGVVARVDGNGLQIPDDSEPGHHLQAVVGDVDLPPVEALARGARIVVMVVVPGLAERDQRKQPVVAAGIARAIALVAEHMAQGIDGVGAVVAQHGRDEEAPYEHLPSRGAELRRDVLE